MRRLSPKALVLVAFVAAWPGLSGYAQQIPSQRAQGVVNSGVTAVLVDVVVRDRRGQPVRDLTEADFQILEDGVPQTVGSFTSIFDTKPATTPAQPASPDASATPRAPAAAGPAAAAANGPTVIALVFDRLQPESRKLAVEAAQGYIGSKQQSDSYIGIFGIDVGFAPYAPFTRNTRALRDALEKMGSRASASFKNPDQKQQRVNLDQEAAMASSQAEAAKSQGANASNAMGGAPGEAMLAQMASNMIRDFDAMERDQQGYSTTDGLFAIINSLRALPGRKSVVFFSEGIALPPAVQRLFAGVIDAANRANVSIYTMDAAGLRAESTQAEIRDELNKTAGAGAGILSTNTGGALSKDLERNEAYLRHDPRTSLGQLAQDTGGLMFESTNNLRQGFDRVESDLRNYYLLGYTSTNAKLDGHFRAIDVKVKRSGVTVAARKGYFALRDAGGGPVNSWEAPALGALEQKPVPNAFPVRAGAFLFPERQRPGLVPVVVSAATAPLTFEAAPDGKTYTSDFAVLVQFTDAENRIARKVSQHYEVKGPISELERAKQGEVIFYREPELAPGVYTMETVVHDAPSGKSSVRFSTVEVPKADPATLRMSSLVLVNRAEKVDEKDRRPENPLQVNDLVLYPNLGEPVSKSAKELGFYFAAYPVEGHGMTEAALELMQNGATVARLPLTLGPADASGRIQHVARLPLAQLAAGTYDLRAVVKQGNEQVFRSVLVRVVD
jgi:VWFA-related protein